MITYNISGHIIHIDKEDEHRLVGWNLYPVKKRNVFYAEMCRWNPTLKKQEKQSLHRFILSAPKGVMVCHLDGDGLNCRKENLSFGNHKNNGSSARTKNKCATSRYRGVHRNSGRGKPWAVMFWDSGKCIYLGRYNNEIEAAKIYDAEALKRFGKFSHLNFK